MKNQLKQILLLLIFVAAFSQAKAQIIPKDITQTITLADCIFEGKVIRTNSYWNADSTFIYTSHTIEISKIFKGDMICGTVEVINPGGRVDDRILHLTHHLELQNEELGLFFCSATQMEQPSIDYYPETNSFALEVLFSEQGFYKYYFDYINHPVTGMFYSFDSLAQAYDLVELYTQLNYVDCQNPNITFPRFNNEIYRKKLSTQKGIKKQEINSFSKIPLPQSYLSLLAEKRQNAASQKIVNAGDKLTYKIENEVMTGNIPVQYLEFDIYLKANDDSSYFDNGEVHLTYDTDVFGTNPSIIVDRGTVLMDVNSYNVPFAFNTTAGQFVIPMVGQSGAQNRFQLTTTPTQAVHVKMPILNCKKEALISFNDDTLMLNSSLYTLTPSSTTLHFYTSINTIDQGFSNLCLPLITDVFPDTLHGGVGELIYIHGKLFGNTQGLGLVGLPNASDNGGTMLFFDSRDSVLWSDTLIVLRVPSGVSKTVNGQVYSGTIGSGILFLVNSVGDTSNITFGNYVHNVGIVGSIFDEVHTDNQKKRRVLSNSDGTGGYKLYPNSLLKSNVTALSIAQKAIKEWNCYSHINLVLDTSLLAKTNYIEDDTNSIILGTTPLFNGSFVAGYCPTWLRYCPLFDVYICKEMDVVVNQYQTWWYDTTATHSNASTDTVDLYETFLHELGHGGNGAHVNSADFVSFPGVMNAGQHAGLRGLQVSDSSISVMKQNVVYSNLMTQPCVTTSGTFTTHIPATNCNGTNGISEMQIQTLFSVSPNPVSNILYLHTQNIKDYAIEIIDITGRLIATHQNYTNGFEINVNNYPQGIYYLLIKDSNRILQTSKFIKQ